MPRARRAPRPAPEEFLRLMSHEMRTPLNGVIGMLGLLSRTRLDGAQRAYAGAARESAEHLLGLVNDLLDYARLDAGRLELEPAPVDLERLVQGVCELLSPRAHEKGLEIACDVSADVPPVLADEGRLRQILFNLTGNAVKFTETGGVCLTVKRRRLPGSDGIGLTLTVEDTGPGIPAEARQRVFEQFGHVDPTDATRYGGAGLGLAVVRKLVSAMDGSVELSDRPGGGARFEVALTLPPAPRPSPLPARPRAAVSVAVEGAGPFTRACAEAQVRAAGGRMAPSAEAQVVLVDHADRSDADPAPTPPGGRGLILLRPEERHLIARYRARGFAGYLIKPLRRASLIERLLAVTGSGLEPGSTPHDDERVLAPSVAGLRVLLVEDNPVGALLAKTLLRREGCTVETAANGHEALAALARARYDLVFMDMRMPGMDGLAATRELRRLGDDTPVIALTANAFQEDRRACLEAGMNDHLTKPVDTAMLKAALARWTNRDGRVKLAS